MQNNTGKAWLNSIMNKQQQANIVPVLFEAFLLYMRDIVKIKKVTNAIQSIIEEYIWIKKERGTAAPRTPCLSFFI